MELRETEEEEKKGKEINVENGKNLWRHRCMAIRREGGFSITSATVAVMSRGTNEGEKDGRMFVDLVELHQGAQSEWLNSKCKVDHVQSSVSNNFVPPQVTPFGYASESDQEFTFGIATVLRKREDFEQLERLLKIWGGPVSAAVGITDPTNHIKDLDHLRLMSPSITQRVDFHFVFLSSLEDNHFPSNFMRNVAFENSLTPYVFHLDIGFVPQPNAYRTLLDQKEELAKRMDKSVLVVPSIKTNEVSAIRSTTKKGLWRSSPKGGQEEIDYEHWLKTNESYAINPSFVRGFAPLLITSKYVPSYDNRFNEENGHGKESFSAELNVAGYSFLVLHDIWATSRIEQTTHNQKDKESGRGELYSWMEYYNYVAERVAFYDFKENNLYFNVESNIKKRRGDIDPVLLGFIGFGVLVIYVGFKQAMKSPIFSSRTALLPLHHKDT